MSIPSSIAEYLSCFSQELGDRILQVYPALQAPQDPVSERFKTLLRSPFAAQRLAVMGIVKRWHRAKAAAVIAECGTGKTLMALSAIHVRSAGRPYTALVMAPPNIVGKWCREVQITTSRRYLAVPSPERCTEVVPRGSNHRPRRACLHHRRLANTGTIGRKSAWGE